MSSGRPPVTRTRVLTVAISTAIMAVGIVALVASLGWRGASFPGFFVLPNRVVPSIGLPGWSGVGEGGAPYQMTLLAVDGGALDSAGDAYRRAALHHVGDSVDYQFAKNGRVESRVFPLHRLTSVEHLAIFGLYFLSGAAYLMLAVLAGTRWRMGEPYPALTMFGWAGALFCFTAMDIYASGGLFRLHALAETMLFPTTLHLALVCPTNLLARRPSLRALIYAVAAVIVAVYEGFLYQPAGYSIIHNFVQACGALPALPLAVRLALALDGDPGPIGRSGVRALLAGTVIGNIVPALVFGLSGATGGMLPVNTIAAFPMFFPLLSFVGLWRLHGRIAMTSETPVAATA